MAEASWKFPAVVSSAVIGAVLLLNADNSIGKPNTSLFEKVLWQGDNVAFAQAYISLIPLVIAAFYFYSHMQSKGGGRGGNGPKAA